MTVVSTVSAFVKVVTFNHTVAVICLDVTGQTASTFKAAIEICTILTDVVTVVVCVVFAFVIVSAVISISMPSGDTTIANVTALCIQTVSAVVGTAVIACVAFIYISAFDAITCIACTTLTCVSTEAVRADSSCCMAIVSSVNAFVYVDANKSITSVTVNTAVAGEGTLTIFADSTGRTVVQSSRTLIDILAYSFQRQ